MQRTDAISDIYPGNSVDKQSQDNSSQREKRINKERNKNVVLQSFFMLKKHHQRDKTWQKSKDDAQRIQDIPVIKISLVKIIEDIRKLAYYRKDNSYKANEKDNVKMHGESVFD